MAKPSITTRTTKGSPLDYAELDANFTNLQDATLTVTDGTNSTAIDLNGTVEFAAGANMTVTESNGVVTLASSGGFAPDPGSGDYEFDGSDLDLNGGTILNNVGNIAVGDDINFPDDAGPAVLTTGGNLLLRGGLDVSSTENDGTITLQANTIQFNATTVNGLPNVSTGLPTVGDNYDVLYEGAALSGDVILRDNTNNLSPQSFILLQGNDVDPSKLESKSYWQMTASDSTESYNLNLIGDVKTITFITGGGVRLPNVTTTERDATNATGAIKTGTVVFNTTTGDFEGYNGTAWVTLG